jgi:hypothetical protein
MERNDAHDRHRREPPELHHPAKQADTIQGIHEPLTPTQHRPLATENEHDHSFGYLPSNERATCKAGQLT